MGTKRLPHLFFRLSYDHEGRSTSYDRFWGFRCPAWRQYTQGDLPTVRSERIKFTKGPDPYVVLFDSPASAVEDIYRDIAGDKKPGRVAVVGAYRKEDFKVRHERSRDMIAGHDGPVKWDNEMSEAVCMDHSTWWAERWIPSRAVICLIGFEEFIELCRGQELLDRKCSNINVERFTD